MRAYPAMHGKQSVAAGSSAMRECDAIVIVTDHDDIDYRNLIAMDKLIVDTRNAIEGRGLTCRKLIKA
jgi:UDP-N-acetyl-D-glucosamine dehydrogenase